MAAAQYGSVEGESSLSPCSPPPPHLGYGPFRGGGGVAGGLGMWVKTIWLWVKTNGIPFWGRCTTHFRTYFSGDWNVHWGYGILTHGHFALKHAELFRINPNSFCQIVVALLLANCGSRSRTRNCGFGRNFPSSGKSRALDGMSAKWLN